MPKSAVAVSQPRPPSHRLDFLTGGNSFLFPDTTVQPYQGLDHRADVGRHDEEEEDLQETADIPSEIGD